MAGDWNGFHGAAKRLDDIDLPKIGATIGVGEDELHAFMDVEAAGSGFDSTGRPKMLFEPHVLYRNLTGAARDKAVSSGIAYKTWGQQPYPKDSYPRLMLALAIDETAALKSASWGLGQILGENFKAVGYDSPQEMVRAFMEDEEAHLSAIVAFLVANKLDDNLRAHDWAGLAKGYNGASYAKNKYDTKLAAAFAKWAKIKDTTYSEELPEPPKPAPADPASTTAIGGSLVAGIVQRQSDIATRIGTLDVALKNAADEQEALRAEQAALQSDINALG